MHERAMNVVDKRRGCRGPIIAKGLFIAVFVFFTLIRTFRGLAKTSDATNHVCVLECARCWTIALHICTYTILDDVRLMSSYH